MFTSARPGEIHSRGGGVNDAFSNQPEFVPGVRRSFRVPVELCLPFRPFQVMAREKELPPDLRFNSQIRNVATLQAKTR